MKARDLAAYSVAALQTIARLQGLDRIEQADKASLVQRLSQYLTRPESVARSLAGLLPHHRATLERLQLHGGSRSTDALGIELRRAGHLDPTPEGHALEGSPDRAESRRLEDVLAHLAARGLVLTRDFRGYQTGGVNLGDLGQVAFIPGGVLGLLPRPRPLGPPTEVPRIAQLDLETTLRDALLYWSYVENSDVQVIARGTIAKRHFVRIAQSLLVPEDAEAAQVEETLGRVHFLRLLLQDAGVLQVVGGRLQSGPRAQAYFDLPDWEQARTLYSAWLDGRAWNEVDRIFGQASAYRASPAPKALAGARKVIAQLVGESPPDQWIGLDEFIARVRRDHYQFVVERKVSNGNIRNPYSSHGGNPLGLWFGSNAPDEAAGWELVEARLIVQFLLALHWLGVVALGFDGNQLIAFRLSAGGRALIRGEPAVDGSWDQRSLVVQASFQIIAYQHAPTNLLAALEIAAERVQAGPVFEYRLSRETAYRARQKGFAAGRVLGLLEAHSATPIPQNVRQSLLDWERQHERIVFRTGVAVLHALRPERIDEVLATPALARSLGPRPAPSVAVLRPDASAAKLARSLTRRGQPVAVTRADEAVRPALEVGADGRIDLGQCLPSIYLLRKLAAFAEERDGAFWITSAGLRRAAESGLRADDVLATLSAHGRSPLPPEVERAIAEGTRRWGEVSLAAVTLVQVENREILDQLLSEPTLRGLLRPLKGQERLAVARPEDADRVRAALAALGVEPSSVLR